MTNQWLDLNATAWARKYGDVPNWATARNDARRAPVTTAPGTRGATDASPLDALSPSALVVIIGSELLEPLSRRPQADWPDRILVLEPRLDAAQATMASRDWTDWIATGRLALFSGPAYTGATAAVRDAGTAVNQAPIIISTALAQGAQAEVAQARRVVADLAFGQSANDGARKASAGRYLLQTLANAARLAREAPIDHLAGLFPARPVIVVAAGPSLDRNVHDLAPVLDRAVIVACDTAARPLINLGVEPDFIVATDGSRANAGHLSSLPASRSWLVAEGGLHPSALTHFEGRTFFFRVANHEPWPWLRSHGVDAATLGTWGSVATSAFSLALALGGDPIIFAGADFAFTDGRPYCRGTSFESLWASWVAGGTSYDAIWRYLVDRWPAMSEPDLRGMPTRTAGHLVAFRNWIVEQVAAHPDRQVVNATDAGLLTGPGIVQQSAIATLAEAEVLNRQSLHRSIRDAHRQAPQDLTRLLSATTDWLMRETPAELSAWQTFTASSVTHDAIASALKSSEYTAWMAALSAVRTHAASAPGA